MSAVPYVLAAQDAIDRALKELREPGPELAPWFATAMGELGVKEYDGAADNPRIVEYLQVCHFDNDGNIGDYGAENDETPWCSAFVSYCLERAGARSTRDARARSYEDYGTSLVAPIRGCIVVLERGAVGSGKRHVTFLDRADGDGIICLGGNQKDKVCKARYPAARVITYRWPG